jgi:hypothetical protein
MTGTGVASRSGMYISLEHEQVTVLRQLLTSAVTQLRIESARTDTHDFRQALHERERIVESIVAKLEEEPQALHDAP